MSNCAAAEEKRRSQNREDEDQRKRVWTVINYIPFYTYNAISLWLFLISDSSSFVGWWIWNSWGLMHRWMESVMIMIIELVVVECKVPMAPGWTERDFDPWSKLLTTWDSAGAGYADNLHSRALKFTPCSTLSTYLILFCIAEPYNISLRCPPIVMR